MYYIAKFLQAAGLTITMIGFLARFPKLIDMKIFSLGSLIFAGGWILQVYGAKK
jgi:hypothetical protein